MTNVTQAKATEIQKLCLCSLIKNFLTYTYTSDLKKLFDFFKADLLRLHLVRKQKGWMLRFSFEKDGKGETYNFVRLVLSQERAKVAAWALSKILDNVFVGIRAHGESMYELYFTMVQPFESFLESIFVEYSISSDFIKSIASNDETNQE